MTRIILAGAAGRMGKEAVKAIVAQPDLQLVAATTGRSHIGDDAGTVAGLAPLHLPLQTDLAAVLAATPADVLLDLTLPESVAGNMALAAAAGLFAVVGTTGLTEADRNRLDTAFRQADRGALICPNFALGALLMIDFAKRAKRYFPDAAIIEWHHAGKVDAPSGTALRTAEAIGDPDIPTQTKGALGETRHGIPIHSIRLPGLLAHQEVVFGGPGQVLTVRHDAMSRDCYMPGLLVALRKVTALRGLIVGLEQVLD